MDVNNIVYAIGMGSIVMEAILEGKINQTYKKNVLHVPKLFVNLLSVNKFVSHALNVQFNLNECIVIFFDSEAIAITPRKRNLYKFNFVKVHEAETANLVQFPTGDGVLEICHRRLS